MKKVIKIAAITGLVIAAGVTQAQAAEADYYSHLMRVVMNTSGTDSEVVSDLGFADGIEGTVGNPFDLADINAGSPAEANVAYFGYNKVLDNQTWTYSYEYWFSSSNPDLVQADISNASLANFGNGMSDTLGAGTGTDWILPQSDYNAFSGYGDDGFMSGILTDGSGIANLGAADSDMYLYYINTDRELVDLGLLLETGINGTVITAESSPVPIPGAVWLLGSGLAGLVGLRRKNS